MRRNVELVILFVVLLLVWLLIKLPAAVGRLLIGPRQGVFAWIKATWRQAVGDFRDTLDIAGSSAFQDTSPATHV